MTIYKITATFETTGRYIAWATSLNEVKKIQDEFKSNDTNPQDKLISTGHETLVVELKKPDFIAFLRDHAPGTDNRIMPCPIDFTNMPGPDDKAEAAKA